jgi:phosphatidylglycerophosphate synthase
MSLDVNRSGSIAHASYAGGARTPGEPPGVDSQRPDPLGVPKGWKLRLEEPMSRYFRYPIARVLVRWLMKTPVTPNQVTLVQPLLAALAGYLITFDDAWHLIAAAVAFEIRSILDCVDGTLARAKKMSSASGHAIDAFADWLGVVFLYTGIFWHFRLHPPPGDAWTAILGVNGVLLLAVFQGATRSFAADYYKQKYVSIYEKGFDETTESLRTKVLALTPTSSFFAKFDVFIGRMGHLSFEHEWFDPHRSQSSTGSDEVHAMRRDEASPVTRAIAFLWSISNGDAFLTLVVLFGAFGQLWAGQLFFATAGLVWIFGVIFLNGWFVRSAKRRALAATA